MSYLTINSIKISGVSACVPKRVEENVGSTCFAEMNKRQVGGE